MRTALTFEIYGQLDSFEILISAISFTGKLESPLERSK